MRQWTLLVVFVAWGLLALSGCGEKTVDPGSLEADTCGLDSAGSAGGTLDAPMRDELNLHGMLLVATKSGLFAVSERGESFMLSPIGSSTADVEVLGTRIFMQTFGDIVEIDHTGAVVGTIGVPDWIQYPISFAVLPDGGFAVFDCLVDSVYFLDPAGAFIQAVDMPDEDLPGHLQIMRGLVLDGKLVVSESGTGKIAEIDLATYAVSVLKSFDSPSPYGYYGDIDHLGRYYYLTRKETLQRFTETGDLEDVAVFTDEYNVTGIAIMRHHAYVGLNFAGKLYKVNLSSGKTKLVVEGLDSPRDVEFIPLLLGPPAGP